ncbi:hypothetical protein Cni_G15241 [Canna indica]|uniref:Uncharacterized protein n=1 Tax=Canna indica TaxID=4628 RepID=A0AAQ3KDH4_9LILI|nr:hypothetical protein Cni_G15241 [Canna indica]
MAVDDNEISALLNEPSESDGRSVELLDDLTSLLSESLKLGEKKDEYTVDDVAWVDSCFEFGTELSDDKWISMKDALLDALSTYPTYYEASSARMENEEHEIVRASEVAQEDHAMEYYPSEDVQKEVCHEEVLVSGEDTESYHSIAKVWNDYVAEPHLSEETDVLMSGDTDSRDNIFKVWKHHVAEHHLSEETQREVSKVEASSTQQEHTESRESIFKVWDLETSALDDEDELIQQLNKLLAGSRRPQPQNSSLSPTQENVDEIVASMSDLALKDLDTRRS